MQPQEDEIRSNQVIDGNIDSVVPSRRIDGVASLHRDRKWVFVWNNYPGLTDQQFLLLWKSYFGESLRYVAWSREVAPTTGTPHLQGFAYFHDTKVLGKPLIDRYVDSSDLSEQDNIIAREAAKRYTKGSLKSFNKNISWQPMYGDLGSNVWYCSKQADLFNWGDPPADEGAGGGRGKRKDLEAIAEQVVAGTLTRSDMYLEHPAMMVKFGRGFENLLNEMQPHREGRPTVIWLTGPSGTCKSQFAEDIHGRGEVYRKMNGGLYFNNYTHQKVVVIEEFSRYSQSNPRGWIFTEFLQLLDKYEITIEVKGGCVKFDSSFIYITSVSHPATFFPAFDEFVQVLRRLDAIYLTSSTGTVSVDDKWSPFYFDPSREPVKCIATDLISKRIEEDAKRREERMRERSLALQMKTGAKAIAAKRLEGGNVKQEDEL